MKDEKLVETIENHCKELDKKIDNAIDSKSKLCEEMDSNFKVKLSDELDKSNLDVKERMRLQRALDKSYNNSNELYWSTNIDTNFEYLEDLKGLVESSNIEKNKKESIINDLEICIDSQDYDFEENEFPAIENAQAGLYEVGVDYHSILDKLGSERLDRINSRNDDEE